MVLALTLLSTKIWYGGTTTEFGRFLSREDIPNVMVDIGHVAVVPRIVFDRTHRDLLPQIPSDSYTVSSKFKMRILKGKLFPPKMFAIQNSDNNFKWSVTDASLAVKVPKVAPPFNDFFSIKELINKMGLELHPLNPIFEQPMCFIRSDDVTKSQLKELIAEVIDHEVIKENNKEVLRPKVGVLKDKIIRTLEEYSGNSNSSDDSLSRLDIKFLQSMPLSTWREVLTLSQGVVTVSLQNTPWAKDYDNLFREILRSDPNGEERGIQIYFTARSSPRFDLMIGADMKVWHGFETTENGKLSYVIF